MFSSLVNSLLTPTLSFQILLQLLTSCAKSLAVFPQRERDREREKQSSPPSIGVAKLLFQLRPGHTDYEYRISVFTDKHSLPNTDIIIKSTGMNIENTNVKTQI